MGKKKTTRQDRFRDEAVRARTGKGWDEWFALLDRAGADRWRHKEIAAYLYERLGCPRWWNQMVAVGYERERGLREKNQTADGYQVSVSKTVGVPLPVLFAAWQDVRKRRRWLPEEGFKVRKATPDKSLRVSWADGRASVDVLFYAKGDERSQVSVDHRKLPDARAVEHVRRYWTDALGRLAELLEGGGAGRPSDAARARGAGKRGPAS